MDSSLKFLLEELALKYTIPLSLYDGKKILTFPQGETCPKELQAALMDHIIDFDAVDYFHINGLIYSSFDCHNRNKNTLSVLIGPYAVQDLIETAVLSDTQFSIPIFNSNLLQRKEFTSFTGIIHNLLKHSALPPTPDWLNSNETLHEIYQLSKSNIESRREADSFEDSVELEKRFLDAVRRNKPSRVEWIISKVSSTYSAQLSMNSLENVKYKCVGIITLLTRISINSGISAIRAYSLSDSLIKSLDQILNLQDCLRFIKEASFMFIELIHHFPYSQKSDLVKKILFFIDSNIYNRITIDDISQFTGRHKTHISSEFKKEMNQTIHSYINKKKIFEAKHLLLLSDQSYKEISATLQFSSQSHFNHVFKKIEGISPAQYRLKNNLNFMAIE